MAGTLFQIPLEELTMLPRSHGRVWGGELISGEKEAVLPPHLIQFEHCSSYDIDSSTLDVTLSINTTTLSFDILFTLLVCLVYYMAWLLVVHVCLLCSIDE